MLIKKGLASIQIGENEDYPEEINEWFKVEEDVREQQIGIWQYGGAFDDEND